MPPKSHNKKRNVQRQVEKTGVAQTSATAPIESADKPNAAVASSPAARPSVRSSATQPAPRHFYVGRELFRVALVAFVTIGILVVLVFVLQ